MIVIRRVRAVMDRHLREAMQNPDRIADILFWPVIDVVTWGLFSHFVFHRGFAASGELVAGIALWGGFRAFQRDMAVGVLGEVWSRNISGLFASPLTPAEYLTGLAIVNLGKVLLSLILVAFACYLLTGVPGPALVLELLVPLGILLLCAGGIGLLVTALILRFSSRVQTLAYGLAGLLLPLSCVFYPLSSLPGPLHAAAGLLPTTQAFEIMRDSMRGLGIPVLPLLQALFCALVALLAAALVSIRMLRAVRRSGQLARMN
jgi:ABC-2 type transport system permease protein